MIKVLLGPNGAGKSTYLRQLMGIETGRINSAMAMVFQEPLLFDLTVFENVALGLKFRKDKTIADKVENWLKKLGIEHLKQRRALTLSGGEAQKTALARALVLEPKTLLLDEPFANLDIPSQLQLRLELKTIIIEHHIPTIWVTHNKEEALAIGEHLMIMINRQIVQEGALKDVLQKPASKEIALFLGIDNIFQGAVTQANGRFFFKNERIGFEVVALAKNNTWAIVRPEDIILSSQPLTGTSARNCLAGRIQALTPKGLTYNVTINAGETFQVNITRVSVEEMGLTPGKAIYLIFKATAVEVI